MYGQHQDLGMGDRGNHKEGDYGCLHAIADDKSSPARAWFGKKA